MIFIFLGFFYFVLESFLIKVDFGYKEVRKVDFKVREMGNFGVGWFFAGIGLGFKLVFGEEVSCELGRIYCWVGCGFLGMWVCEVIVLGCNG